MAEDRTIGDCINVGVLEIGSREMIGNQHEYLTQKILLSISSVLVAFVFGSVNQERWRTMDRSSLCQQVMRSLLQQEIPAQVVQSMGLSYSLDGRESKGCCDV